MDGEQGRLGSAQVRWNDYVGTAAADDADTVMDGRSLYEIAGVDRERWRIVGLDFSRGAIADHVVFYAMDQTGPVVELAESDEVPVTAFHVGGSARLDQLLTEAFKQFSVRLLSSTVSDKSLVVTEHSHESSPA